MRMIERGVYDIPLMLSKSLEPHRDELQRDLINAQRRLRDFALRHQWGRHIEKSFAQRAEIYDDQLKFIEALLKTAGADPSTALPDTVSAALENDIFMSISPDVYSSIYPQGIEKHSFEKLITHEMAHRLHIRILNNDEEAMGPLWFFEGFAIYAAGQFADVRMNTVNIHAVLHDKNRGSYLTYGATIRYLLNYVSLREMVENAGSEGFNKWLLEHTERIQDE